MAEIRSFNDLDEMMSEMAEAEKAANEQVLPAQAILRDSRDKPAYWFHPTDDIEVWGHCWTDAECHASSIDSGCDPDEAADETERIIEARLRGYMFGRAFSVVMPAGEIGSTHVSQVVPIPKEVFDLALFNGWSTHNEPGLRKVIAVAIQLMLGGQRSR